MASPITIAEEILDSGDTQAQKNALTFLRVLGDGESIRRLVHVAVEDPKPELRSRASEELDELDGAGQRLAADALNQKLKAHRAEGAGARSYYLLGRLNQADNNLGFLSRLRFANATHGFVYPAKGLAFYRRNWWTSLVGAALGSIALLGYLRILTSLPQQATVGVILSAVLLSVPAGILVTYRATPYPRYAETIPAVIVESLWALSGVFVLGIVGVAVSHVMQIGAAPPMLDLVVALAITVGLIRMVTILAFGAAPLQWGSVVQALAGGGVGAIALTAFALLEFGGLTSDYWPTLTALAFGIATAFAVVDRDSDRTPAPASTGRRWATGTVIVSCIALAFWAGVRPNVADTRAIDLIENIKNVPSTLAFWIPEQQTIAFGIRQDQGTYADIYLRDSTGQDLVTPQYGLTTAQQGFERTLKAGIYTVEINVVGQYSGVVATSQSIIFPLLTGRPAVLESLGSATALDGEGLAIRLMTSTPREIAIASLEQLNASSLPEASLIKEVDTVPFLHEFRVAESQAFRVRLRDMLGGTDGRFRLKLESKNGFFSHEQVTNGLVTLTPGAYRLIVDRENVLGENFPDTKLSDTSKTLSARTILPGRLALDVNAIDYRPGTDVITMITSDGSYPTVSIPNVPSIHFIEVTGSARRTLRVELVSTVVDYNFALRLYDDSGRETSIDDGFGRAEATLVPGVYSLLIEAYSYDGGFAAEPPSANLPLNSVSLRDTSLSINQQEFSICEPPGGQTAEFSADTLVLDLPVSRVPFVHSLTVPAGETAPLCAMVQQTTMAYRDYVLSLYDSMGRRLDSRDDPEMLTTSLRGGETYWLAVETYPSKGFLEGIRDGQISGSSDPVAAGTFLRIDFGQ